MVLSAPKNLKLKRNYALKFVIGSTASKMTEVVVCGWNTKVKRYKDPKIESI